MYYFLIGVFVIVCLFLIVVILLQAGRGGGLTEAFGGAAGSVLGTHAPAVLKKATTISAVLFLVLSLLLAVLTTRRGRSLFQQVKIPGVPSAVPYPGEPVSADAPSHQKETAPARGDSSDRPEEAQPLERD